jgi:hypothetical protein
MAGAEREPANDPRELFYLATLLGILVCFLFNGFTMSRYSPLGWQGDDFPTFYAAGKLSGTGSLYDYPALRAIERQYRVGAFGLPFVRLPAQAWVLKPLAALPYRTARIVWLVATCAAAILFVFWWPAGRFDRRLALAAWFLPIANCILGGQDDVFSTLLGVAAARWLAAGRDSLGGFAIGSAFFKPNLGIGLAVFLLATRRWRAIGWATVAALLQIAVSFLAEGTGWLRAYSQGFFEVADPVQPNLRGLAGMLPFGQIYAEIILAAIALVALWIASRRLDCFTSVALALATGLLTSHHANVYDITLAYPVVATAWTVSRAARLFSIPLLLPALYLLPYFANLSHAAFVVRHIGIVAALIGVMICVGARRATP